MSNQNDFAAHEAAIRAVDAASVKHPTIPMGVYLQEAEDLCAWAKKDLSELAAKGLDPKLVEEIPTRCGAVRHIQSQWNSNRFSKEEAQKKFALLAPDAYDLCARIIHEMLFAYRKQPDIKGRVQAIAEGSGDADMIQDLSDLAVHGKNNPGPLAEIKFDMKLLDEAESKSDELASMLATAHGEKATDSEIKVTRDKAYTYLKEAVDEIREFGQHTFWRDPTRLTGYASEYMRRTRKKSAAQGETETTDAP